MNRDELSAHAGRLRTAPDEATRDALRTFLAEFTPPRGLVEKGLAGAPAWGWGSHTLFAAPEAEVCAFFLRRGRSIPFHDHPGHVFQRLLHGTLRVVAYDWVDPGARLARPSLDATFSADDSIPEVRPTRRAVHRVEALSDAAFLDLLVPPYGPDGCTYYRVGDAASDDAVRLVPCPPPG